MSPQSDRVALVVNPTAGKGSGRRLGELTRAALVAQGHEVLDVSGVDYAAARERAERAVADGVETLVVVGGDGMVHLGTNLVATTPTRLLIVAGGTGNDVAANLGLPVNDPAAAVALLRHGTTRAIDAGLVRDGEHGEHGERGDRWFAGVLGAGFDAVVNARAQRMRWPRGQMRYNLAILRELPVFRPIPYAVELDGTRIETRAMLVTVANTSSFGGGMRVSPDADPADGLFDVMIVHELSIPAFLRVFPKVFSGTHVNHPAVEMHRATRVRLEADGIRSQADGESFTDLPIDAEVVPGALRVVVPALVGTQSEKEVGS
ncbi:diacylglycerol kinase [Humibacillus xanthopallidus]|uniref:Diacylglycerol kinase n=1 Tax=Humibacillus xanthopallidus TaxID=412689 RepID=A0A543PV36_9MICO|nr:YegS/Rv2252/BmrU family lipid kinase [Humibacillus xanthopallidus]TQN47942.1 diacylglycerol kinase [Humibacillus xanthopallidus]